MSAGRPGSRDDRAADRPAVAGRSATGAGATAFRGRRARSSFPAGRPTWCARRLSPMRCSTRTSSTATRAAWCMAVERGRVHPGTSSIGPMAAAAGFSYPLPAIAGPDPQRQFPRRRAAVPRATRLTGDTAFLGPRAEVARYSAARQHDDGSWDYGEAPTQRWIDNFHTGYNLCALHSIGRTLETAEFEPAVRRGFEFYRGHFFREDGAPRYFHDRTYPIDIHCVAQSIITLVDVAGSRSRQRALAQRCSRLGDRHTCGTIAGSSTTACCGSAPSGPRTCDGRRRGCSSRWPR